jgi:flagellar basal-body rod protein FlgG
VISGLFTTIDNALVQENRYHTIANNIANAGTSGFKKDLVSFTRIMQSHALEQQVHTDFSQGNVLLTGNQLDVALTSRGFFTVATDQGDRYTTNGAFMLNAQGILVDGNGDPVLGENGPLALGEGQITIDSDGQVFSNGQLVDRLAVVDFNQIQNLVKEGNCLFRYEGAQEDIVQQEEIHVKQGFLEKSNVNPTEEMVKMIEMFRSYESNQKVIQTMGEMSSSMFSGFGFS